MCLLAPTVVPRGGMEVERERQRLQPAALAPAQRQPPGKLSGPRSPLASHLDPAAPCKSHATLVPAPLEYELMRGESDGAQLDPGSGGNQRGWRWWMEAMESGRRSPARKAPGKINGDREGCWRAAEQRDGELGDGVWTGG